MAQGTPRMDVFVTAVRETEYSIMFGPIELTEPLRYLSYPNTKNRDVGEHRNFYCSFYTSCLKIAAGNNWQSFTCKYCPNFETDYFSFSDKIMVH